jgi:hypothetical protein
VQSVSPLLSVTKITLLSMLTAIPLHYMRDLYGSVRDDYSFQVMLIGGGARILFMHRCRPGAEAQVPAAVLMLYDPDEFWDQVCATIREEIPQAQAETGALRHPSNI